MPEKTGVYQVRLKALRKEIADKGLDGVIIPRTDEFQGEFLAPYAQRLEWLCGFTGSAGSAAVLKDAAVVMSDGRYTIQLRQEVDEALYTLEDSTKVSLPLWLSTHTHAGMTIGFDPWLYTKSQILAFEAACAGVDFIPLTENPIDTLWHEQPERPQAPVFVFPDAVAGKSAVQKRAEIALELKESGAQCVLLSAADSICWLLNVRGGDVDYTPLVHSYAVLWEGGALDWFIHAPEARLNEALRAHIGAEIQVYDFAELGRYIENKLRGAKVQMDRKTAPIWFEYKLESVSAQLIDQKDPCLLPKSIKSAQEIEVIKEAHKRDGIAVTKFLGWVKEAHAAGTEMDEVSVAEKLESFRAQDVTYHGPSFATISGFNANGAIIHYHAVKETCAKISGDGLLLLDSGGQYKWGTTDITRTIALGTPTQAMREHYTLVLKGHIALSMAIFPEGTTGMQVDVLARAPLWTKGLDFAHGTGHGVGCFLGVHEDAANIFPRGDRALKAGMVLSNEPGFYQEGEYGIRIENLVVVVEKGLCAQTGKKMLGFETLTYAPYDETLIIDDLLSMPERKWLEEYKNSL